MKREKSLPPQLLKSQFFGVHGSRPSSTFSSLRLCIFVVLRVLVKAKNRLDAKKIAEAEAKAKAEAEKAEADKKAAEEAAAALAAKQADLERSILAQEKLLSEMCEIMKKK